MWKHDLSTGREMALEKCPRIVRDKEKLDLLS
jgi:hypothetical protein